jgi:NAD-dependent dihydropyrimidine dehydrogenase PreA subunit
MSRPKINPAKVRIATQDPNRPGEQCRAQPGVFLPLVDRNRCEGKADCAEVCPYEVFDILRMRQEDFAALTFVGKVKSLVHGRKTAYTPNADQCRACGLCVVACPENAITLVQNGLSTNRP